MSISLEVQEKAKAIILAGLRAQPHGSVRFCDIHATVRLDADDEEFLDISVIYDGPRADLNFRLLISLHDEIEPQLREMGIRHVPSVGYIDKAECGQPLAKTSATLP